jgi:uncharacterized protein with PQ loop repeat
MAHPSNHHAIHLSQRQRKRVTRTVDGMAYFVGIFGNAAVIPQIIRAWQSDAPGLAITTWVLFVVVSCIWLAYAILHRQRPLIVAQSVGLTANVLVVSGWLANNV